MANRRPKSHHLEDQFRPDWTGRCENCGASPTVPISGLCGPCHFGQAAAVDAYLATLASHDAEWVDAVHLARSRVATAACLWRRALAAPPLDLTALPDACKVCGARWSCEHGSEPSEAMSPPDICLRIEQIRNQLDAAINLVPAKEPCCLLDRIDRDLRQLKKDIGHPLAGLKQND